MKRVTLLDIKMGKVNCIATFDCYHRNKTTWECLKSGYCISQNPEGVDNEDSYGIFRVLIMDIFKRHETNKSYGINGILTFDYECVIEDIIELIDDYETN
jgi:hypothetical protein